MGLLQKFVKTVLPTKTAEAIEAESRSWIIKCETCGTHRSVWDLGGIRYKAAGKMRLRAPCPTCGKRTWHTMSKAA